MHGIIEEEEMEDEGSDEEAEADAADDRWGVGQTNNERDEQYCGQPEGQSRFAHKVIRHRLKDWNSQQQVTQRSEHNSSSRMQFLPNMVY